VILVTLVHVVCLCTGKMSIIKYIFNEATLHSNSNLLRKASGPQSCLSVLYDGLILRDANGGNTPLHLCAEMLANCGHVEPGNKHLRCINLLLDFIEHRQQRVEQCERLPLLYHCRHHLYHLFNNSLGTLKHRARKYHSNRTYAN